MLEFRFELRPLADVTPWGRGLHWFGLTQGWYWISTDAGEMLRYTGEAVRRWELERPYPGYYVVRLWEDLLVLRWALEEPVPDDVVPFIDGSFPRHELPDDLDLITAEVDAAFDLQSDFALYLGYLTDAPDLRCWRDDRDVVTLRQQPGPDSWAEPLETTVAAGEFFAAVEDFDRRLIAAMDDRVAELERTGPPPGVELDVAQLRAEHTQRSRWLGQRLAAPRHVDWPEIRAGITRISSWPRLGSAP